MPSFFPSPSCCNPGAWCNVWELVEHLSAAIADLMPLNVNIYIYLFIYRIYTNDIQYEYVIYINININIYIYIYITHTHIYIYIDGFPTISSIMLSQVVPGNMAWLEDAA